MERPFIIKSQENVLFFSIIFALYKCFANTMPMISSAKI